MNVPLRRYWRLLATYLRPQWPRATLLALLLLAGFFSRFVIHVAGNALLMVGVLALLYREDRHIGLAATLFAVVASLAMLRMYVLALPLWTALRQTSALFFGALGEAPAATEDLRALGAVPYVTRRFVEKLRDWLPLLLKAVLAEQAVWMVSLMLFALANAAALLLGTALLRQGAAITTAEALDDDAARAVAGARHAAAQHR